MNPLHVTYTWFLLLQLEYKIINQALIWFSELVHIYPKIYGAVFQLFSLKINAFLFHMIIHLQF